MAEPLKHLIGPQTARDTADAVAQAWEPFDKTAYLSDVLATLDTLELMQRGKCIANALHRHLPADFEQAVQILHDCLPAEDRAGLTAGRSSPSTSMSPPMAAAILKSHSAS